MNSEPFKGREFLRAGCQVINGLSSGCLDISPATEPPRGRSIPSTRRMRSQCRPQDGWFLNLDASLQKNGATREGRVPCLGGNDDRHRGPCTAVLSLPQPSGKRHPVSVRTGRSSSFISSACLPLQGPTPLPGFEGLTQSFPVLSVL